MSVIAYHLIWTNYGTWLPNDPRGSGSITAYTPALAELGDVHLGRKTRQPARSTVREFYTEAEPRLQFDVIRFDENQCLEIGNAFEQTIRRHRYTCYACAIMPDHVHFVFQKHRDSAEEMIAQLQYKSHEHLHALQLLPLSHPVWTKGGWKVFLNTPKDVWGRIRYVESNPLKDGFQNKNGRLLYRTTTGRSTRKLS